MNILYKILVLIVVSSVLACGGGGNGEKKDSNIAVLDADGDGHCRAGQQKNEQCPDHDTIDCDDTNADVYPGNIENCATPVDDNCNKEVNEHCDCPTVTVYRDGDNDDFGDLNAPLDICEGEAAAGYVISDNDCNDEDPEIHPDAAEVCGNDVDENCNTLLERDVVFYADGDDDGFGDPDRTVMACPGDAPSGYVDNRTDCDDEDGERYPGADGGNDCNIHVMVASAAELHTALGTAAPGTIVTLAAGTYTGRFEVTTSGEVGRPITIKGPQTGIARLVSNQSGYRGALEIHNQHHIIVDNLEISNPNGELGVYLTGENGDSRRGDGCAFITLRNLHVHDVNDEGIKIRNLNTHDILIENNRVHTTSGSGIDVQGAYPDAFPEPAARPRRIVIRNNLIWDVHFAGIANEVADQLHIYNNIVLDSAMGLDIGCGNHIIIKNNLVTSYAHYAVILENPALTNIDLDQMPRHATLPSGSRGCLDGIAVSGTYMTLIFDNEITDCNSDGDLIISYDHHIDGRRHNIDGGHRYNLFFRNRLHNNNAYQTIIEFDKQTGVGAESLDQFYFNNLFANNRAQRGIIFEHSVRLLFANNTIVNGDDLHLSENSDGASVQNNIFHNTDDVDISGSEGGDIGPNVVTGDDIFMDPGSGDFHLNRETAGACIDQGIDMSGKLDAVFQRFKAAYGTADFDWHTDFSSDIVFDFYKDFDGDPQDDNWDIGAYSTPR